MELRHFKDYTNFIKSYFLIYQCFLPKNTCDLQGLWISKYSVPEEINDGLTGSHDLSSKYSPHLRAPSFFPGLLSYNSYVESI
jgi:hypothetical protein